jgi:hypothetical protein
MSQWVHWLHWFAAVTVFVSVLTIGVAVTERRKWRQKP